MLAQPKAQIHQKGTKVEVIKNAVENEIRFICSEFEGAKFDDESWCLISSHLECYFMNLIDDDIIHSYRIILHHISKYCIVAYLFVRYAEDDFYYPYTLKLETYNE